MVAPLRPLLQPHRRPRRRSPAPTGCWAAPRSRWCAGPSSSSSVQKLVTKPLAIADRTSTTAEFLAQIEAVDRFTDEHDRLPGPDVRAALPPVRQGQRARRPARSTSATATIDARQRSRRRCWSSPAPPTASPRSPPVKAVVPLLTGADEVRFEIVPGGHLGMLTGRARPRHDLAGRWTSGSSSGRRRTPAKKAAPRKKTAAKKAAAKKTPAAKKRAERGDDRLQPDGDGPPGRVAADPGWLETAPSSSTTELGGRGGCAATVSKAPGRDR